MIGWNNAFGPVLESNRTRRRVCVTRPRRSRSWVDVVRWTVWCKSDNWILTCHAKGNDFRLRSANSTAIHLQIPSCLKRKIAYQKVDLSIPDAIVNATTTATKTEVKTAKRHQAARLPCIEALVLRSLLQCSPLMSGVSPLCWAVLEGKRDVPCTEALSFAWDNSTVTWCLIKQIYFNDDIILFLCDYYFHTNK